MSARDVETEIKIPVSDLEELRPLLLAAGAKRLSDRHDEENTLYDDAAGSLAASGRTLRLRAAGGRTLVTWKGPARVEGRLRTREEVETAVENGPALAKILERLNLRPRFRYQKRREEFELEGCAVALDETPIGTFVEVEGRPDRIRAALAALRLDAGAAVVESYPALYRRLLEKNPGLPPDMLFTP